MADLQLWEHKLLEQEMKYLLAEFDQLRKEIDRRSREQYLCISGSVISTSAILALVVKDVKDFYILLIVIPWLMAIFGGIWEDHDITIGRIGNYISCTLEEEFIKKKLNSPLGWETHLRKDCGGWHEPSRYWSWRPLGGRFKTLYNRPIRMKLKDIARLYFSFPAFMSAVAFLVILYSQDVCCILSCSIVKPVLSIFDILLVLFVLLHAPLETGQSQSGYLDLTTKSEKEEDSKNVT